LVSFNAGELSPRLEGRVDLAKYSSGCRTLENFLPTVQGPVIKRSGSRYVSEVKDSADITRLIPFEFGTEQAYMLEFGDLYVRVLKDSGHVLEPTVAVTVVAAATPIRITTGVAHGYATGQMVFVSGTLAAGINGSYFNIIVIGATTFDLVGTASLGAFGAGGTVARAYEFATPYTSAQLVALQYAQSADVLYLAHPEHPPRKVSRTANTSWTLSGATGIAFDAPPFAQENLDKTDFLVATAATGTVSLYSTGGHFVAGHVGGYVKLAETLEGAYPEWIPLGDRTVSGNAWWNTTIGGGVFGDITENRWAHYQGRLYWMSNRYATNQNGTTPPLHEDGFQNDGTWEWRFVNPGYGWVEITAVTDAYFATGTVVRELGRTVFQATATINAISGATPNVVTTAAAHGYETGDTVFIYGSAKAARNNQIYTIINTGATTFSLDGTVAGGGVGVGGVVIRVKTALIPTRIRHLQCTRWALGAFSAARGYPTSVAFFEDRLIWAGTNADPQGVWASRTGRYEDHLYIDEDDGALFLLLNTQQINKVEWLSAGKRMAIGTAGGEFVLSGPTEGAVTAGNAHADQHSYYGARESVAPLRVESVTLFVQRSGKKLIEYGYDYESDNYQGQDLTILSHHVTLPKLKELAWAQEPDRIIWAVLEDGQLVALTYDRAQEVVGWHRHPLGGTDVYVESVATIPHPDGARNQVWMIVRRTINGGTRRYLEFLEATWESGTALADSVFVDSATTYSGAPATTITGLWHLIGQSVLILGDGLYLGSATVSSTGTITLSTGRSKVHAGLQFNAILETMRLEAGAADGTAQGKTKRITNVVLRVEDTGKGLQYGPALDLVERVDGSLLIDGALLSGDTKPLRWNTGYEQAGRLNIRHAQPLPCTIVAILPQVVTEDG
jgi:hypothetical protein